MTAVGHENEIRDMRGCIVTLTRRDNGEQLSRHIPGLIGVALPAFLDKYDPRVWMLETFSTENTIRADLKARQQHHQRPTDDRGEAKVNTPEASMLTRLDRNAYSKDAA